MAFAPFDGAARPICSMHSLPMRYDSDKAEGRATLHHHLRTCQYQNLLIDRDQQDSHKHCHVKQLLEQIHNGHGVCVCVKQGFILS